MSDYSVLLPAGPNETVERLQDLLDSLALYEPASCDFLIVDDTVKGERAWKSELKIPSHINVIVIKNPRKGKGAPALGGLCCALLAGLKYLHEHSKARYCLRFDTDSICIGPFNEKILAQYKASETTAILGTYLRYPDGSSRLPNNVSRDGCHDILTKMLEPFAFWRFVPVKCSFQIRGIGRSKRMAAIVEKSKELGYQLGYKVQGGGYSISSELMGKLAELGLYDDVNLFRDRPLGEDTMMSMLCVYAGFGIKDYNQDQEVFGVTVTGLAFSVEQFYDRGYSLLHSVKGLGSVTEAELRAELSAFRERDRKTGTTD